MAHRCVEPRGVTAILSNRCNTVQSNTATLPFMAPVNNDKRSINSTSLAATVDLFIAGQLRLDALAWAGTGVAVIVFTLCRSVVLQDKLTVAFGYFCGI